MENKKYFSAFILMFLTFFTLSITAQDTLKLKSGSLKRVQILNINAETVHFKPTPESPNAFYFAKTDIEEIWFQNGTKEKLVHPNLSLQELQAKVIGLLNDNAHLEKSKNPIAASFDGDYLKLSDKNQKVKTYDLAKVFAFQPISYRTENLTFLNIVVMTKEAGSETWNKEKIVLNTESAEKAVLIQTLLKKINALLIEKNGPFNKK